MFTNSFGNVRAVIGILSLINTFSAAHHWLGPCQRYISDLFVLRYSSCIHGPAQFCSQTLATRFFCFTLLEGQQEMIWHDKRDELGCTGFRSFHIRSARQIWSSEDLRLLAEKKLACAHKKISYSPCSAPPFQSLGKLCILFLYQRLFRHDRLMS